MPKRKYDTTQLTSDQKADIRYMYRSGKYTITDMARQCSTTRYKIVKYIKTLPAPRVNLDF